MVFKASTGEGRRQAETPRVMSFYFYCVGLEFWGERGLHFLVLGGRVLHYIPVLQAGC